MNKNPKELADEIRLAAAIKWYELGKISESNAARLAGLSRSEFNLSLLRLGASPSHVIKNNMLKFNEKNLKKRKAGLLKGKIELSDDFNDPLDEMKEYME